jgi:hypothetical protein
MFPVRGYKIVHQLVNFVMAWKVRRHANQSVAGRRKNSSRLTPSTLPRAPSANMREPRGLKIN